MQPHDPHPANLSFAPLVNRVHEMSLLKDAANAAIENQGKLVLLCGEAGIGKTRLTTELYPFARLRGMQMLYGRAPASFLTVGGAPYSLWKDVMREYLTDCSPDQLSKVVGYYPSEICKLVPEIRQKIGAFSEPPSLDPEMERDRLFEAVTQFMTNISRTAPLVVILDDLQWADQSSLLLLSYLTRGVYRESLLLLGAYRDSEVEDGGFLSSVLMDLNRARLLQYIKLKRLSSEDVTQLVKQVIGQSDVPKDFCEFVFEKTAGNPFFVEEVVSSLREEGVIVPEKGLYPIKAMSEIEFPKSVRDVLKARAGRVDDESQKVLSLASAIGNSFPFEALREVTGIEENRLLELVENLEKASLLRCRVTHGEDVVAFADVLVRDVLYQEISPLKRKRLHRLVGEALEKAYSGKLEEHLGEMAVHFLEGGDTEKALDYYLRAGEAAKKVYANIEAASHFRSVYELLKEKGGDPVKLIEVLETLANLEELIADYDACLEHRNQEVPLLEKLGEKQKIATLYRKMSFVLWMRKGNVNEAREYQDKALQILTTGHESAELVSLKLDVADMLWHTGDQNKAYSVVEEALEISERLNDAETMAHGYQFKGKLLSFRGEFERSLECLKKALKLATNHCELLMEIECYSTLGAATSRFAEETSMEYFRKGYELARKVGALSSQSWIASHMALNLALRGNTDSAFLLAEEAVALDKKSSNLHNIPISFVAFGDVYRVKGEYVEAEKFLTEALQVAQKSRIVPSTAFAAASLANLYYDMGRYAEAKEVSKKEFEVAKKGLAGTNQGVFSFSRCYVWSLIELGEFEEVQKFIDESWKNPQVSRDSTARDVLGDITAKLQRAQGKWSEAIEYFERRIHDYEVGKFRPNPRVTIIYYARNILYECALAYIGRNMEGDKKSALVLLNQALDIFQRTNARKRAELVKTKIAFVETGQEQVAPASPIKTGYEPLDRLMLGGIPSTFAVAVTSPSCDERNLLVKSFLEAGVKSGQPTFYLTLDPALASVLAQDFPSTFFLFVCNPQAETAVKIAPNVFPLKGIGNLTNINIALTSATRKLNAPLQKGSKRLCLDIMSDVLLQHGPVVARKWLSELLIQLRASGFTVVAIIDPQVHPSDHLYAVLSMFDGEVSIREAETGEGFARFLKVKRMSGTKYMREEMRLTS